MVTTIMTERWGVPELNRRTRLDAGVRERQRDVAGLSRGFAGAVPIELDNSVDGHATGHRIWTDFNRDRRINAQRVRAGSTAGRAVYPHVCDRRAQHGK